MNFTIKNQRKMLWAKGHRIAIVTTRLGKKIAIEIQTHGSRGEMEDGEGCLGRQEQAADFIGPTGHIAHPCCRL